MDQLFDFALFPEVRYDHLLRGRTGAFVDNLRKRGFFIYYFERPPDSPLQYFKDPIGYNRGLFNFLFPKPIVSENIEILPQPPILPAKRFNTGLIKRFNRNNITKRIIEKYIHLMEVRKKPVVAFIVTPWWYDIIDKMDFALLCYDCIDDLKIFCEEKELNYFSNVQKRLVEKSDLILISAQKLKDEIIKIRADAPIEYIPNGVDADFFIKEGSGAGMPASLVNLPKPTIGFIGSLFNWVDISLIEKTAQAYPNASVVLVGPVQGIEIPKKPNIVYLGPQLYSTIPAYINSFDVCLIPFIADPLSDKVNPIKVYEYLSLGKPVVAINLSELEKMRDLIYLAKDNDDFILSIKKALNENNPELKSKRIQYARENSWDIRVEQLIAVVKDRLKEKIDRRK